MPGSSRHFSISTDLGRAPAEVWAHALSMRGINRELFPLVRMTGPPKGVTLDPAAIELAKPLFRSWILLFGFLPVDYDDLTFVEIEPGRRFLEKSTLLTQREWVHERTIEPTPGGCRITDSIRFTPRVGLFRSFHLLTFQLAFRLRHRNLARLFRRR